LKLLLLLLVADWENMKFELLPMGDFNALPGAVLTGLVLALFSWFMLGAGPFDDLLEIKLSKSMLMLPALDHVEPIGVDFLAGSAIVLLLVELLLIELEGRRMLSAVGEKSKIVSRVDKIEKPPHSSFKVPSRLGFIKI
jgi:hypothetical protein